MFGQSRDNNVTNFFSTYKLRLKIRILVVSIIYRKEDQTQMESDTGTV